MEIVKCDMHVHSYYSGACTTPYVGRFCRESYSDPQEVYERLKHCGMDLFTLTDHDSIEGGEQLRHHPNFFLSEELTCRMPSGTEVHIGVYDLHERQHVELQRRRNDLVALLMYLSERRLFFSINHVFSSLTGRRELDDFRWFERFFPAIETHNGHMPENANGQAALLAKRWDKIALGGSDAHALRSVGTVYTEVPGVRTKEEFLAGLRNGNGKTAGESGKFSKLTRDVFLIGLEMMREKRWTTAFAPLALLVPIFTMWNYRDEEEFVRRWAPLLLGAPYPRKRRQWFSAPLPAVEEVV